MRTKTECGQYTTFCKVKTLLFKDQSLPFELYIENGLLWLIHKSWLSLYQHDVTMDKAFLQKCDRKKLEYLLNCSKAKNMKYGNESLI